MCLQITTSFVCWCRFQEFWYHLVSSLHGMHPGLFPDISIKRIPMWRLGFVKAQSVSLSYLSLHHWQKSRKPGAGGGDRTNKFGAKQTKRMAIFTRAQLSLLPPCCQPSCMKYKKEGLNFLQTQLMSTIPCILRLENNGNILCWL